MSLRRSTVALIAVAALMVVANVAAQVTGTGGGAQICGAPVAGYLAIWSTGNCLTNGDLTGDVTTTHTTATTIKTDVVLAGNPTTTTQAALNNSTRIATTAYADTAVANGIAGSNPAIAVKAATTQASDTSGLTYANGVGGIGATLTGSVSTAVTIDGVTFTAVGQRLLVKNDTQSPSGAFNGVYTLTVLQTGILAPVFTRALDYDTPSDINNTGAIPVISGTANASTTWVITSSVATVGTDPMSYTQLSINPTNIAKLNTAQSFTAAQRGTPATLTISTATFTPNFDTAQNFTLTLIHASCPCTLANPSTTPVAGQSGLIEVIQSATGSDLISTWGSDYTFGGGTSTIALSAGASARDYLSYYVADSTHIVLSSGSLNATH